MVLVVVRVDDTLVSVTVAEMMKKFVSELGTQLTIKDLREASYYMGWHISRDGSVKYLRLDQHLHARDHRRSFRGDQDEYGSGCGWWSASVDEG